jgi:adenosylmethionine-8-amino-7-oxononanoate aminotransferase
VSEADDEVGLAAELWRPSEMLEAVENRTVQTAKFLHAHQAKLKGRTGRASVDDAIALADCIIALAGHGRKQIASQASQIAAQVEFLVDLLASELENLED